MIKILQLLNKSATVTSYKIEDFKQGSNFYYIRVKVKLTNKTTLFIREYASEEDYSYSYHWQKEDSQIIIRWDNAPHHKQLKTFPHHKHVGKNVLESNEIGIQEVLEYIESVIRDSAK